MTSSRHPLPGEIPFKTWAAGAALAAHITVRGMQDRFYRGKVRLRIRRVNKRVVYVKTP